MSKEKVNPNDYAFFVSQPHIAGALFSDLIKLGYVPTSDEVLDIADIVFVYIYEMLENAGVPITIVDDEDDLELEE